jgi:aryl carrier-like protein
MNIDDLRKTLAAIDGRLRALAPTKSAWHEFIVRADEYRCDHCNQHASIEDVDVAMLAASISLENLLDLISANAERPMEALP